MKRILFALLAACMLLCFCACAGEQAGDDSSVAESSLAESKEESKPESKPEIKTFKVKVVDEAGNPVNGVALQICKELCMPAGTGADGIATFYTEITDGYKLSITALPDGYEYTGEAEIPLTAGITEYTITLSAKQ